MRSERKSLLMMESPLEERKNICEIIVIVVEIDYVYVVGVINRLIDIIFREKLLIE